jgi:hypothetical protein
MTIIALPHSIQEINALALDAKMEVYKRLLPPWLEGYGLDRQNLTINNQNVVEFRFPNGSRSIELWVKSNLANVDPIVYLHMVDTFNNQILVLLAVINDQNSPRFDVDVDNAGNPTHFGTSGRNREAEEQAMNAGLAPGQVRRGLRVFRQTIPYFEDFITSMGHDLFLIEPLAYHNAISFERYGFSYVRGYQYMLGLDREFRPGGALFAKLQDSDSVFRTPDAWKTVRGRSWAIHDGILDQPFSDVQMFKRIGHDAQINTFHGAEW